MKIMINEQHIFYYVLFSIVAKKVLREEEMNEKIRFRKRQNR